jgi:kynurenine formamidase
MGFERIIDLSHPLRPGREGRQLDIERIEATDITGAPSEEHWYIMHRVRMDNHIGTHMEAPYHGLEDGADLAQVPIEQLVGEAVILDLRVRARGLVIPLQEVQQAAQRAGGVGKGDIVFCMTGWARYYGSERYAESPFLTQDAVRWLVDSGIKMLGIDTGGRIDPSFPDRQNHLIMFESGVIYLENLTSLDAIPKSRVTVVALPPAIDGMEAFPARVVALL